MHVRPRINIFYIFFYIFMLQFYRCWSLNLPSLSRTLRYPWEGTSPCLVSSAIWEITKYLNLIYNWFLFCVCVCLLYLRFFRFSLATISAALTVNCRFLTKEIQFFFCFIVGSSVTKDNDITKKIYMYRYI